nr:immunoglobulin light chain junction region [Macaca mulatta]MOW16083.1 immunoglobulin light chain junction region [Macaca mulatta]MOW17171.1 immunoglobulin light chain junction region [Macaca mulatta]
DYYCAAWDTNLSGGLF